MRRFGAWLVRVAPALLLLAIAADAVARVGGGESYGRGGSSSGGGSSGGGGGVGDIVWFLVWLCIRFPAIGIPVTLLVVGVFVFRGLAGAVGGRGVYTTRPDQRQDRRVQAVSRRPRTTPGLAELTASDPAFSLPVLLDLLILVHRRAYEAVARQEWGPLEPYVAESARPGVKSSAGDATILEVVVGSVRLASVERRGGYHWLRAKYEVTRLERDPAGQERRYLVTEEWTFRRADTAKSLPPEAVERMGCPSCGVSIEGTKLGACPNCGSPIGAGQLQWQATGVALRSRNLVTPPKISWWDGGQESSVSEPSIVSPNLPAEARALRGRHPDFDEAGFQRRVTEVFLSLQAAWSAGKWQDARPFTTDSIYQTLRFQVERYTLAGLQNRLDDVELSKLSIVKVSVDAWYEAITVRLWAQAKDYVVDAGGKVVGGNDKLDRKFSEYWTFLRAAGTGAASKDSRQCPSCGAPIDRINAAGICEYCGSKITTGRFDWVLSRIEQPEAYEG
jgi:hypothetical protein